MLFKCLYTRRISEYGVEFMLRKLLGRFVEEPINSGCYISLIIFPVTDWILRNYGRLMRGNATALTNKTMNALAEGL